MNDQPARFCLLGLRSNQVAIACRYAEELGVAAMARWITRCVIAWESTKTTVDVPAAISTEIDKALTEALRQASVLPACDADDISCNVKIVEDWIRVFNKILHSFVESVPADQESAQDAFLLGWQLADLEDPELTDWESGNNKWSTTMPKVEELLQRMGMTLNHVLGDVLDDVESLEDELPAMRCKNWLRLETGLAARCQPGLSDLAGSDEENNYGLRFHFDNLVERTSFPCPLRLSPRLLKLLRHFVHRDNKPTPLYWFRNNWQQFGQSKTCEEQTVYAAIHTLNEELGPIDLSVRPVSDSQGWVLESVKPVS
jgi:hypothetical protein